MGNQTINRNKNQNTNRSGNPNRRQSGNPNAKRNRNGKRRFSRKKRAMQRRIQKMITGVAFLLILIFGVGMLVAVVNPSTKRLIKSGVHLMEDEKYEKAQEKFKKALEKDNSEPEAYRGMGMIAFQQEKYEDAYVALQKVVELEGEETPMLYNLMGISAMKTGEYEKAVEAFEQGIACSETVEYKETLEKEEQAGASKLLQEMLWNRVVCYERLSRWEEAKSALEDYQLEFPEDSSVEKEEEFLSSR